MCVDCELWLSGLKKGCLLLPVTVCTGFSFVGAPENLVVGMYVCVQLEKGGPTTQNQCAVYVCNGRWEKHMHKTNNEVRKGKQQQMVKGPHIKMYG